MKDTAAVATPEDASVEAAVLGKKVAPLSLVTDGDRSASAPVGETLNITIQTIADISTLEALAPEWDNLAQGLSPRLPFQTPLWCLTWWKHMRRDALAAKDTLNAYAMRDQSGRLLAIAPMFLTRRPGRGPIQVRELQFFGADPNVTELRGLICDPEDSARLVEALDCHIHAEKVCDWVQWRGVREAADESASTLPFEADKLLGTVDHYLKPGNDWDSFRGGLSRNIKESLRKCYNSLKRDKHAFELRVVDKPEEASDALDVFFALHQSRADKTGTIDHGNVFETPAVQAFLKEYCTAIAEQGGLRIFQLMIEDKVVATRVGFQLGDELYLYFSGYDVAWSRYSIMTTAVAEAIKWSIDKRISIVNLSTGTDVSKTRWRPESITYKGGYSIAAHPFSRAVCNLVRRGRLKASEAHGDNFGP